MIAAIDDDGAARNARFLLAASTGLAATATAQSAPTAINVLETAIFEIGILDIGMESIL